MNRSSQALLACERDRPCFSAGVAPTQGCALRTHGFCVSLQVLHPHRDAHCVLMVSVFLCRCCTHIGMHTAYSWFPCFSAGVAPAQGCTLRTHGFCVSLQVLHPHRDVHSVLMVSVFLCRCCTHTGMRTAYSWFLCFSAGVAPTQGRALRTHGFCVSLQVLHPHRDAHCVLMVSVFLCRCCTHIGMHTAYSWFPCFSAGVAPTQGCALRTHGFCVSLQVLHPHRDVHSILMVSVFLCRCCTHTGTRTPYSWFLCFSAGVAPTQGRALRTHGFCVSLQVLHPHRDAHSVLMVSVFLCRCCTHTGTRTPYSWFLCFSAGAAPTQGCALRTHGFCVSLQVLHPHRDAHSVLMVSVFLCRCCTHTGTRTAYSWFLCFSAGVAPTQGCTLRTHGFCVSLQVLHPHRDVHSVLMVSVFLCRCCTHTGMYTPYSWFLCFSAGVAPTQGCTLRTHGFCVSLQVLHPHRDAHSILMVSVFLCRCCTHTGMYTPYSWFLCFSAGVAPT